MKKLFTYLLISSMVVLSSCTNYDDQFDDLNSQLSTLKSQIDGFSSLSSGLTALQGTVSSLQAAVAALPKTATPATDISGLQSSLTALAATVAELKTKLDSAATAADVAALQTALTAQQADLTKLLAQNNIYSTAIVVNSQASLDFATALGDKVTIVNAAVTITHSKDMNDAQVATLMGKMVSVTGAVIYSATTSTTATGTFSKLTSAASLAITQTGDISLPMFATSGTVAVTGDALTTSVSLPKLVTATTLTFAGIDTATSFSMPSMVSYDLPLTINIANTGSIDLSAFTNATTVAGVADTTPEALTINAATLTAPVYAQGVITADRLTSVNLPKWEYAATSSFDRAATVVLPSVNPGKATSSFEIAIQSVFDAATSVNITAAANTHTGVLASEHVNITSTSTKLESLTLAGTFTTINVTGPDVTAMSVTGTAHSVTVNATDVATLDLAYTSAAKGILAVTANTKLTSLTADKVDGLASFTLTGNSDLTDISFAALKTVGATGANVAISGNDLAIDSVSSGSTSPVVAKKVVSADFNKLNAFLTAAIAGVTATSATQVMVSADLADVVKAYTSAGVERDAVAADAVLANYDYLAPTTNAVGGVSKVDELYITALGGESSFKVANIQADGTLGAYETVSLMASTGLEDYYDVKNWADAATTTSALTAAGLEILSYGKGAKTATFKFADATLTNVSAVVSFSAGVETVSVTTGSTSSTISIAAAIKAALDAGNGVVSQYYTVADDGAQKLTFSSNAKGSHRQSFDLTMTAKLLSGTIAGVTSISFAAASKIVANSIESTSGAYIRFKSTTAGAAGARSITLLSDATVSATLLTASGISTAHAGDDEAVVTAVTGTANTLDNSAAIALVSVNNVQYLVGA